MCWTRLSKRGESHAEDKQKMNISAYVVNTWTSSIAYCLSHDKYYLIGERFRVELGDESSSIIEILEYAPQSKGYVKNMIKSL